jgi:hypothetical protein
VPFQNLNSRRVFPQPVKPNHFVDVIGRTGVVRFQSLDLTEFFRNL